MSNREKKIVIVCSVLIGVLLMAGLAVGINNAGTESHTGVNVDTKGLVEAVEPKKDTQVSLKSDSYEDVVRGAKSQFVTACAGEGATVAQCGCMYDHLDNSFTNDEFTEYLRTVKENDLGDAGWEAVRACSGA